MKRPGGIIVWMLGTVLILAATPSWSFGDGVEQVVREVIKQQAEKLRNSVERIRVEVPAAKLTVPWDSDADRESWKRMYKRAVISSGNYLVLHRKDTLSTRLFKLDEAGSVLLITVHVSVSEKYTSTTITTYKTDSAGETLLGINELYVGSEGRDVIGGTRWDTSRVGLVTVVPDESERKHFRENREHWVRNTDAAVSDE